MTVQPAKHDDARSRAKRNAWLLALAAMGVYGAVIVWYLTGGAA
ncbi:MAG TPA: hypothetical protein VIC71_10500 [Gammaproteobacteria bacterium]|jgi:hypothetical protein